MPRGVARAVTHPQFAAAYFHGVAVGQPAVGRERFGRCEAEHEALLRQRVDPELVGAVRPDDRQVLFAGQHAGAAGVVDVRMREQDLLERHASLARRRAHALELAAGVDHRAFHCLVAPDERAVLLKRGDRNREMAQHRGGDATCGAGGGAPRASG